ncbi:MAG: ribonuclease III [Fibrobacterota bacterium]
MIDKIKSLFGVENIPEEHSSQAFSGLEKRLGYTFKDKDLLRQALTHKSSIRSEEDPRGLKSNERLEFLGDAVVDCLVTEEIYKRYREKPEGQLSKIKSLLVSRKILGIIAARINLTDSIITGKSEKKNKGGKVNSIASNAFEAVLGAAYLDSGLETVRTILEFLLFPSIEHFINDVENRNYKSRILEMAQGDKLGSPRYITLSEKGPEHQKSFTVAVEIANQRLGEGIGKTKKEAQQEAARLAITRYTPEFVKSLK